MADKNKMTKKEFLKLWNKQNPSQQVTINDIEPCGCSYPRCKGWFPTKEGHSGKSFK